MEKVSRVSGWVMVIVGIFLILVGIGLKEWGKVGQGAFFVFMGWAFLTGRFEKKEG